MPASGLHQLDATNFDADANLDASCIARLYECHGVQLAATLDNGTHIGVCLAASMRWLQLRRDGHAGGRFLHLPEDAFGVDYVIVMAPA